MSSRSEKAIVHEADELQPCYVCKGKADRLGLFLGTREGRIQHYHWRPLCKPCFFRYLEGGLCLPTARLYHDVKGIPLKEAKDQYDGWLT